jgi:hypothetical protein
MYDLTFLHEMMPLACIMVGWVAANHHGFGSSSSAFVTTVKTTVFFELVSNSSSFLMKPILIQVGCRPLGTDIAHVGPIQTIWLTNLGIPVTKTTYHINHCKNDAGHDKDESLSIVPPLVVVGVDCFDILSITHK